MRNSDLKYFGNKSILELNKTAFLCSRKIPAEIILKSYDWAKEQRKKGNCVICGNHSTIEKDVFEILLRGNQPIILVLARGMMKRWPPEILYAVNSNRLLVISPFPDHETRVTRDKAEIRNKLIFELADKIVVGHATKGGQLDNIIQSKNIEVESLK